jgi:signal transduction histidine kinase/ActR/RegA family two-component response regulator
VIVDAREMRVLILAPTGRDAATVLELLTKTGITADICPSLPVLLDEARYSVGVVFIAEEALQGDALATVEAVLGLQEPWSDLPFVMLSSNRDHAPIVAWREKMLKCLQNVTLLERPVQGITLVSAVRAALRARRRQYEVREHIAKGQRGAAELERLVAARTRELEETNAALHVQIRERAQIEERLRHAQKIEAIGQLTGGVAHDFNNLLMVISGGLDMLSKRPERRIEVIKAMQKAAARGASLTHQLLAFSRRQELKPQAIDLKAYFAEVSELLDRSLRGDVDVTTDIAENVWPINADPGELQLVILNLAVNARDAMPGGGKIVIHVENAPGQDRCATQDGCATHDCVRITVSDTGMGMTPDVIERVFEPFFTTKDVGKGSGLGLAQVHGFVTQSGGSVKVTSEVGIGTTVEILLPRSAQKPTKPSEKAVRPRSMGGALKGHVLLVEDEDEVAALVAQMLKELGYEVTRANSASAALGALANGRPIDLVFSDVMMPGGMNGLELSREIRKRRPDVPVLLTSGYADVVRQDAQTEGVPLLSKPYQLDDLASAIEKLHINQSPRRVLH